jgi:ribonuclease HII
MSKGSVVLGIDEAGRGPVIGDMFVACVGVREELTQHLKDLGVRDSKSLTPRARAALFPKIVEVAEVVVVRRYGPATIDASNLNNLFVEAVVSLVKTVLGLGIKVSEVYVDALSSLKHERILVANIPTNIKLVYEHKADVRYPVVAAASIIAKFLRDTHVGFLHSIYGDFGSGYPSDPRTIKWLAEHAPEETPIVRKTWSTLKKLGLGGVKSDQGLLKWLREGPGNESYT